MAYGSMQQLRNKRSEVLTAEKPVSLLDSLEVAQSDLLTAILDMPVAVRETTVAVETAEERWVELQLVDWTLVLIPCPACQCYPCKPGHVNGHTEQWIPVAGDVVKVRI